MATAKMIHCPFHEDRTPSLRLDADGTYYCYACMRGKQPEAPEDQSGPSLDMLTTGEKHGLVAKATICVEIAKAEGLTGKAVAQRAVVLMRESSASLKALEARHGL